MRICVISAARNVAPHLPFYRQMVEAFVPPAHRVVICENDSWDGTDVALHSWLLPNLDVFSVNTGEPPLPREATAVRAAHLARVRNLAIERALDYKDWDIALMQDVQKYSPAQLPAQLVEDGGDIVAPMIWLDPFRRCFYDIWCFRDSSGRAFQNFYPFSSDKAAHRTLVTAVGGVYVVRRAVFEAGCRLSGTDGKDCDSVPFCQSAIAKGFRVWLRQDLSAYACMERADWYEVFNAGESEA